MSPVRRDLRVAVALCGSTDFPLRGSALPFDVRPMADHGPDADVRRSLPGHHAVLPRTTGTAYGGGC